MPATKANSRVLLEPRLRAVDPGHRVKTRTQQREVAAQMAHAGGKKLPKALRAGRVHYTKSGAVRKSARTKTTKAARGFDDIVATPRRFLAGEAGPERVKITPLRPPIGPGRRGERLPEPEENPRSLMARARLGRR